MNIRHLRMKKRATYSIAASVKIRLEELVPRSERLCFVEGAMGQALRAVARARLKKALDELPAHSSPQKSTTDFLRLMRLEWDGRPIDLLEGRDG
jgi:hypothetical protein